MKERSGQRRSGRARRARVETSAGGVVFRRGPEPQVLLIRDPYDNWGLPKGHIEGGETPEQAAVREVGEETGLAQLEVITQLPTIDWYFRDHGRLVHKFCHFFLLEARLGEPVPQRDEGITDCQWLSLAEAVQTVSYANAREVIRVASDFLTTTC
ncbi:MAG: NUDIX hydrolase [Gemmatimonadetes bacterium]|nr:NUDIX hydrolase [Gemmatimonadota bacterium]